jgi:hypothetical protein
LISNKDLATNSTGQQQTVVKYCLFTSIKISKTKIIRYTQSQKIGITFIRYTQSQKIGITFIRYTQNQKIGITFIRYTQSQKIGITFIRYTQSQKIGITFIKVIPIFWFWVYLMKVIPIFWPWVYLMKVIPIFWFWVYLMKVIPIFWLYFTDINECDLFPDICDRGFCTNTKGSFVCSCPPGLSLDSTGRKCVGRLLIDLPSVNIFILQVDYDCKYLPTQLNTNLNE